MESLIITLCGIVSIAFLKSSQENSFPLQISENQQSPNDAQLEMSVYLKNISEILGSSQYKGKWTATQPKQLEFLTEDEGDSYMNFIFQNGLIVKIFGIYLDPKYFDQRSMIFKCDLANYNQETQTWSGTSQFNYTNYFHQNKKYSSNYLKPCTVDYQLSVQFPLNQNPSASNAQISMSIQSLNENCEINLTVLYTLDTMNYNLQKWLFCSLLSIICVIQILSTQKVALLIFRNPNEYSRFSMFTPFYFQTYHLYWATRSLLEWIFTDGSRSYILPSIFYLLLSYIIDIQILVPACEEYIYNIQGTYVNFTFNYFYKQICRIRIKKKFVTIFFYYWAQYFLLMSMYILEINNIYMVICSFFMVPQIIHNAFYQKSPTQSLIYIFGVLLPNMLSSLYLRGCPQNVRLIQPSIWFCVTYSCIYILSAVLLLIQHLIGPRSIIPKFLLPKPHQYLQKVHQSSIQNHDECAICLGNIYNLNQPNNIEEPLLESQQVMITPCKHRFHQNCLIQWMEIKLQCPTCRRLLPPLQPLEQAQPQP